MNYADRDLELYNKWKQTGDKKALRDLINAMIPFIQKETNRLSGSLPESAIRGELVGWAMKAINTFDPSKGVKLSTHTMNWLQKARRLNYTYQNLANMGEDKQLQFREYNHAKTILEDELGRDPTHLELSNRLGWKPKEVEKYQSLLFADHAESGNLYDPQKSTFQTDHMKLNYIMSKLNDTEKKILQGRNKKKPSPQIAASLGMNLNQYNYASNKLTQKIKGLIGGLGEWN